MFPHTIVTPLESPSLTSCALVADAVPAGRARFRPGPLTAVPAVIADLAKPGDLVLTMGAGDVTTLGPTIVAALRARGGGPDPGQTAEEPSG